MKLKRIITSILVFVMVLSTISVMPYTASAASNPYPQYNYYNSANDYQISCTWYAWKLAYERIGVALPSTLGNALTWYSNAKNAGYSVGSTPKANSLAVWNTPSPWGHVAYVTGVNANGSINIEEGGSNWKPNSYGICSRTVSPGQWWPEVGFIYLTNDNKPTVTNSANIANGYYKITSQIDNNKHITFENSNVVISTAKQNDNQIFYFERQSDNTYKIICKANNKVIDVAGAGTTSGTKIGQYDWNNTNAQHWYIVDCGSGWYKFIPKCANLTLDVIGGSGANGTGLQIFTDNGTAAQRFSLVAVTDFETKEDENEIDNTPARDDKENTPNEEDTNTSDWSTTKPNGKYETKKQYRYKEVGKSWVKTGTGTHYYFSRPDGFDSGAYTNFANAPISSKENGSTKRTVSNATHHSYIYWHWAFTGTYGVAGNCFIGSNYGDIADGYPNLGTATVWEAFDSPNDLRWHTNSDGTVRVSDHSKYSYNWFILETYKQDYTDYSLESGGTGSWSDWQDEKITASDDVEVETRTVYRSVDEEQKTEEKPIEKETCWLFYDANGGTGATAPLTVEEGTKITITDNEPTRNGYIFVGWSKNESANSADYNSGDKLVLNENITLYAIWERDTNLSVNSSPSDWAIGEVEAAIKLGLVPENLQKNYTMPVYRLEIAEMFINLIEEISNKNIDRFLKDEGVSRNTSAFTDTQDDYVLAANALGIINGVGNKTFDCYGTLTRAEITAIINRTANVLGVTTNGYSHNFVDVTNHWCNNELGWPTYAGVINGVGDNRFAPDDKLTTEQAIAITYRAYQELK